jgi:DNA-directed RNA polymerase alpha subunit
MSDKKKNADPGLSVGPILYPAPDLPNTTPIDRVRFSTRIRNALIAAGWKTIGDIREASDATLLSLQDIGKGSVAHLRECLVWHHCREYGKSR